MAFSGYIRFPALWGDNIIFTAEDDLWKISTSGGRAERLTAGVSAVAYPAISPGGSQIAFVASDEGAIEVYVMPFAGGSARRLTFHNAAARVVGWSRDGSSILYTTAAQQASRRMRTLFSISVQGGEPQQLPYGIAHGIAFGPNNITVIGRNLGEPAHWKRYRGGTAGYFWIDRTGEGTFERFLELPGNMSSPCWVGDRFYFISDHEGIGNVYSCTAAGTELQRHTFHEIYYARNLSTDGQQCVYHCGGDVYVFDPVSNISTQVAVDLTGSQAQRSRKFVSPTLYLDSCHLHPAGHAVAITTRGKAFSMPNFDGAVLQHGELDGVRYRQINWLADGKQLAAIADDGTEPRIIVFSADGLQTPRVLQHLDIGHVFAMVAAPKGNRVALSNHRNDMIIVDLDAETLQIIDHSDFGRAEDKVVQRGIAWSADGAWLAYSFAINRRQTAIKLHRLSTGETVQATDPVLYDMDPAFDPKGRYLYFLGARDFDPVADNLHFEFSFPKGYKPYLITLRNDIKSPFSADELTALNEDDDKSEEDTEKKTTTTAEEKIATDAEQPAETSEQHTSQADTILTPIIPETATKTGKETIKIDIEGITQRIVAFPVPEGRYGKIMGIPDGALFTLWPVEGTLDGDWFSQVPAANASLEYYKFKEGKQEQLVDGVTDISVTPSGKYMIYRAGLEYRVLRAGEQPPTGKSSHRESKWIDLDRARVGITPLAEWKQMFAEAWRLQREHYWIADMAGIDWNAVYQRYAPLVERITTRGELSDLIWEMQGELGTSHAYEIGGDYRRGPRYPQGFLGCDWQYDAAADGYTITHIVAGDQWNTESTSPLRAPGIRVQEGDILLAINGQRVSVARGPQQLLVNQAGNDVKLALQSGASGEAYTVTVHTLSTEYPARYREWVEANRRHVHDATQGRVGYIHVPDMGADGYAEFHRGYLQEYDRAALIVDVRWNGGGNVSGLLLEKLSRQRLGYDLQRWGPSTPYPSYSTRGVIVALTDENAGSDGDIFSHAFKMLQLGPLVGKRTWGGVIGIDPQFPLVDGTYTTQPEFSFWFSDVGWGVENYGTDPTVDVDYPPQAYMQGIDPQLDWAIAEALLLAAEKSVEIPRSETRPMRGYPMR